MVAGTLLLQLVIALLLLKLPVVRDALFRLNSVVGALSQATGAGTSFIFGYLGGGPPGFLRVLDEHTLGFADFRGNRQYISLGNLAADDRAALFLVDYPNRARLKILAHTEIRDLNDDPALAE